MSTVLYSWLDSKTSSQLQQDEKELKQKARKVHAEVWMASHLDCETRFAYLCEALDQCISLGLPVRLSISSSLKEDPVDQLQHYYVEQKKHNFPIQISSPGKASEEKTPPHLRIQSQKHPLRQFEHLRCILESLSADEKKEEEKTIILLDDDDVLYPAILEEIQRAPCGWALIMQNPKRNNTSYVSANDQFTRAEMMYYPSSSERQTYSYYTRKWELVSTEHVTKEDIADLEPWKSFLDETANDSEDADGDRKIVYDPSTGKIELWLKSIDLRYRLTHDYSGSWCSLAMLQSYFKTIEIYHPVPAPPAIYIKTEDVDKDINNYYRHREITVLQDLDFQHYLANECGADIAHQVVTFGRVWGSDKKYWEKEHKRLMEEYNSGSIESEL